MTYIKSGLVKHKTFSSSTTSKKPIYDIFNRLAAIWKATKAITEILRSETIDWITEDNLTNHENLKKSVNLVNLDVLEAIPIEIIPFEIFLVAK